MVEYKNIEVEIDGEKHRADVSEFEVGYEETGYICKVLFSKPIKEFHGFKKTKIFGLTTEFYCGDKRTIIEVSGHKTPLQDVIN